MVPFAEPAAPGRIRAVGLEHNRARLSYADGPVGVLVPPREFESLLPP
jgi:hypothetical protein